MRKIYIVMILIASVSLTACAGNQKKPVTDQQSSGVEETLTFNHALFTLDVPAPFESDESRIKPINENDFPQIVYGVSEMQSEGNLLTIEEEGLKNLCGQTDTCGKIIENEEVTINNVSGIMFTVRYDGRRIDDPTGYLLEYHYSLQDGDNLFRFWTSANDLEEPEDVKQIFEEIIGTIAIK